MSDTENTGGLMSDLKELAANRTADVVVIGTGWAATIEYWFTSVINPILTGLVMATTVIWTCYRIRESKKKKE